MTDEEYARRLLKEHLVGQGRSGFMCAVNPCDPPDLLVTWANGSQWGVEVTRTYLQVAAPRARTDRRRATVVSKPTASGCGDSSRWKIRGR